MDYTPKHAQPFTFAQACELEIPTITKEITRLENSLFHLNRTQAELKEHLSGVPQEDRELADIIKENDGVIASQKERIIMLKLALEEQGINARSAHYESIATDSGNLPTTAPQRQNLSTNGNDTDSRPIGEEGTEQGDNGVYL